MKKIVIIPGVGYQTNDDEMNGLGHRIKSGFDCEYSIFKWDYNGIDFEEKVFLTVAKNMALKNNMSYQGLRDFTIQVMLDFEYALKYGNNLQIPQADYYIGHSAGTLFAISQNKPSTIMGSPVAVIQSFPKSSNTAKVALLNKIERNSNPVLDIINSYDVIAYPINKLNIKNIYFHGFCLNPAAYFPITAHTGYWTSKFVSNQIINHLKEVFLV